MARGFYKEVTDLLKQAGYSKEGNAKGAHEKWSRNGLPRKMIVPRPIKSRHTANAILKDAGIDHKL